MSIATEIARLQQAKADLKTAINNKGGTITNETIDQYASKVSALPSPKEEQQKTISPSTSQQDVLPDSGKVLSKVTVNAIPTETKSQQPNLSSGNQTINATSGKFMTSFTITKDTVNHIASNIRSGKTLYGVTGNLQPAKEEETKTITPDFSSGNVVVTPTTGKVLSQVTINKDANLIADNIKSGVTIFGITGTYEGEPSGFTVTLDVESEVGSPLSSYSNRIEVLQYSIDNGSTWVDIDLYTNTVISNVSTIKFKGKISSSYPSDYIDTDTTVFFEGNMGTGAFAGGGTEDITTNATITTDTTIVFSYYDN